MAALEVNCIDDPLAADVAQNGVGNVARVFFGSACRLRVGRRQVFGARCPGGAAAGI